MRLQKATTLAAKHGPLTRIGSIYNVRLGDHAAVWFEVKADRVASVALAWRDGPGFGWQFIDCRTLEAAFPSEGGRP